MVGEDKSDVILGWREADTDGEAWDEGVDGEGDLCLLETFVVDLVDSIHPHSSQEGVCLKIERWNS